ncbi:MAG: hypothetical protein KDI13_00140 [Alphaproteobacteria bacterium]|nr:hypothetical protein [Alphaproteobacteria bacterium]
MTVKTFGYAQFCDDIREEKNGKITLVGVYHNDIIVPEIPAFLPKFYIMVNIVSAEREKQILPLKIEYGDDIIADGDVVVEFQKNKFHENIETNETHISLIFSPFPITKEDFLKVKIKIENEWTIAGQIFVQKNSEKPKKIKKKSSPKKKHVN